MDINRVILFLSLIMAIVAWHATAASPATSFATQLLTEVHGLRLGRQIVLSVALKQKTGSYLPTTASLTLLDNYLNLNQPQDEVLYDQVRTLLGANREEFDNLVAIRQLEHQCKQLVTQQNQDSETDEELANQARQLFAQHQHLFDAAASQRLTTPAEPHEQLSAEESLLVSLIEEEPLIVGLDQSSLTTLIEEELGVDTTNPQPLFRTSTSLPITLRNYLSMPRASLGYRTYITTPILSPHTAGTTTHSDYDNRGNEHSPPNNENTPSPDNATIISSRDNINTVSNIKSSKDYYRVPDKIAHQLIRAVYKNNSDDISRILDENFLSANIVIDDIGTTLLQHAASEGKLPVVQYLIDTLAAAINIENKLHFTTLDAAVFAKQYSTASFLIVRGAVSAQPQGKRKGVPTLD